MCGMAEFSDHIWQPHVGQKERVTMFPESAALS